MRAGCSLYLCFYSLYDVSSSAVFPFGLYKTPLIFHSHKRKVSVLRPSVKLVTVLACGVEWYWAGKLTKYDMRVWIWVCVFVNSELHRKNFAQILSLGSVFDQTFSEYLCCTKENHPDWEVFIFSLLLLPERNNMGEQKSTHQGVGSWRGSTT